MHAEIVGAGFAGLTAAIALKQRGWSVRVHEAGEDLRALGAGIFIWENGLRVLKTIGAYDAVMAGSHHGNLMEARVNGKSMSRQHLGTEAGSRMVTMTRQHLYSAMIDAARRHDVEILTRSEVVAADPSGSLRTASGQVFEADLVIGADGVKSQVRDSLDIPMSRHAYQDGVIRLLVPWADPLPEELDHVIDFWNLEPSPLRVLYVPCGGNKIYLCMMAPRANKAASAIPVNRSIWQEAFPMIAPVIGRIENQGRYDTYEMTRLQPWSKGRVAIIGDAAHAMPPTLGQGAGCAIMNALGLAVALQEEPTVETALQRWEARERPLTDHTQDQSVWLAKTRKLSEGQEWDDNSLRTARHVPTGTES